MDPSNKQNQQEGIDVDMEQNDQADQNNSGENLHIDNSLQIISSPDSIQKTIQGRKRNRKYDSKPPKVALGNGGVIQLPRQLGTSHIAVAPIIFNELGKEVYDLDTQYVLGKKNARGQQVPMVMNATQAAESLKINQISGNFQLKHQLTLNMEIYNNRFQCLVPTLVGDPAPNQKKNLIDTPRLLTSGIVQFTDSFQPRDVVRLQNELKVATHSTLSEIAGDNVLDDFEQDENIRKSLEKRLKAALRFSEHVNTSCPHYVPSWRLCGCIPNYYPNRDKLLVHTPQKVKAMSLMSKYELKDVLQNTPNLSPEEITYKGTQKLPSSSEGMKRALQENLSNHTAIKMAKKDRYVPPSDEFFEQFYGLSWNHPDVSLSKTLHTCGSQFYKERHPSSIVTGINVLMQLQDLGDVARRSIGSVNQLAQLLFLKKPLLGQHKYSEVHRYLQGPCYLNLDHLIGVPLGFTGKTVEDGKRSRMTELTGEIKLAKVFGQEYNTLNKVEKTDAQIISAIKSVRANAKKFASGNKLPSQPFLIDFQIEDPSTGEQLDYVTVVRLCPESGKLQVMDTTSVPSIVDAQAKNDARTQTDHELHSELDLFTFIDEIRKSKSWNPDEMFKDYKPGFKAAKRKAAFPETAEKVLGVISQQGIECIALMFAQDYDRSIFANRAPEKNKETKETTYREDRLRVKGFSMFLLVHETKLPADLLKDWFDSCILTSELLMHGVWYRPGKQNLGSVFHDVNILEKDPPVKLVRSPLYTKQQARYLIEAFHNTDAEINAQMIIQQTQIFEKLKQSQMFQELVFLNQIQEAQQTAYTEKGTNIVSQILTHPTFGLPAQLVFGYFASTQSAQCVNQDLVRVMICNIINDKTVPYVLLAHVDPTQLEDHPLRNLHFPLKFLLPVSHSLFCQLHSVKTRVDLKSIQTVLSKSQFIPFRKILSLAIVGHCQAMGLTATRRQYENLVVDQNCVTNMMSYLGCYVTCNENEQMTSIDWDIVLHILGDYTNSADEEDIPVPSQYSQGNRAILIKECVKEWQSNNLTINYDKAPKTWTKENSYTKAIVSASGVKNFAPAILEEENKEPLKSSGVIPMHSPAKELEKIIKSEPEVAEGEGQSNGGQLAFSPLDSREIQQRVREMHPYQEHNVLLKYELFDLKQKPKMRHQQNQGSQNKQ